MKKTLSITIDDIEKVDGLTLSGPKLDGEFNPNVTVRIGNAAVVVNSKELAEALAEIVSFQTPTSKLEITTLPSL